MSKNNENRAKGNYISAAMNRGASNKEARESWDRNGDPKNYDSFWGYHGNHGKDEKEYDHGSDANMGGKGWHTSDDL